MSPSQAASTLCVRLASANAHKLAEIRAIFAGSRVRLLAPRVPVPQVRETGLTFAANARIKARAFASAGAGWVLADDSGLEVDALGGDPGVHSSRFLGPGATDADRNRRLLELLAGTEPEARTARYRCAVAVSDPDGAIAFEAVAVCEGRIALAPRGSRGFGYDPIFLVAAADRTMAELTAAEKNRISHRGKAVRAALRFFEARPQEC